MSIPISTTADERKIVMRIEVDAPACRGYALCIGIAPEYFELDENSVVALKLSEVPPADQDRVREASLVCPTLAITVVED